MKRSVRSVERNKASDGRSAIFGENLIHRRLDGLADIVERQVVFIPDPEEEGKFVPRTVQAGPAREAWTTIRSGVEPGEVVVTEGSFFLRAEWLRNTPTSS